MCKQVKPPLGHRFFFRQMHHRKMSFLKLVGDPKRADADLLASDGQVIPFHSFIFQIIPDDRKLDVCKFEEYIDRSYLHCLLFINL
jgi:hypothetical protein